MKFLISFSLLFIYSFAIGQKNVLFNLPKTESKKWAYIPNLDFKSDVYQGNDSVNFLPQCQKIVTSEFFVYKHEITNKEYLEFLNEVNNKSYLPDTNAWNTDFVNAYLDPMRRAYFRQPNYADYPVVGISQIQALAYSNWLQNKYNTHLAKQKTKGYTCLVSLPSDKQWESVFYYSYLKNDDENTPVVWLLDKKLIKTKSTYHVNYGIDITKEGMGVYDYIKDGGMVPVNTKRYKPSKDGIYNLMGNVAEWTISPAFNHSDELKIVSNKEGEPIISQIKCNDIVLYDTSKSYEYWNDRFNLKPVYKDDGFVAVKGGSWRHSSFYLQPSVSLFCKPNDQHSYIGFRPVITFVKHE